MDPELDDLLQAESLEGLDIDRLVEAIPTGSRNAAPPARQGNPTREVRAATAGDATGVGHEQRIRQKVERRTFYDLSKIPNAVRLIRPLPVPGETIHALMGGDFACWDLAPAILDLAGKPADELWIATLGFNAQNNWHLCRLMDEGRIANAHVLASDYFAKADAPTFNEARAALGRRGGHLTSTRNHAKVIALAIGRDFYVVEGSANMRSCNNLEQFTLTNDRAVFQFHRRWIAAIP